MKARDKPDFYRRHLPHIQPAEAQHLVTARLAGSLPGVALSQMREEYDKLSGNMDQGGARIARLQRYHEAQMAYFKKFHSLLDSCDSGPRWLGNPVVAKMVFDAILFQDARCFSLSAFCIMPNHIHLIVDTAHDPIPKPEGPQPGTLTDMLASLKSYTAHEANRLLNRSWAF
jgi:hypothetical protein